MHWKLLNFDVLSAACHAVTLKDQEGGTLAYCALEASFTMSCATLCCVSALSFALRL